MTRALSSKKSASNSSAPSNQTHVKPTKSASGPHCYNYDDINNMEKTQTEEASQTKNPYQELKNDNTVANTKQARSEDTSHTNDPYGDRSQRNGEMLSELMEIIKSLRNF